MHVIDSHIHVWRTSDPHHVWVREKIGALRRDRTIEDFAVEGVAAGAIVVEAAETVAETIDLCTCLARSPHAVGVVGWLDLEADDAADTIERLSHLFLLKGVRLLPAFADGGWQISPRLAAGLRHLARAGLTLDVLARPEQLDGIRAVKDAAPDLRVMINHGGRPLVMCGMSADWRDSIMRLARDTDAACKLSGLVERAGFEWNVETLRPFADVLFEALGPSRLAYASNWPMLDAVTTQRGWAGAVLELMSSLGLGETERDDVFHGTAARVYRLDRMGVDAGERSIAHG